MGKLATAGIAAIISLTTIGAAQATLIGGPVPNTTFGGTTAYTYVGTSVAPFTSAGGGSLQLASAAYVNAFGVARVDGSSPTQLFSGTDAIGTTRSIAPGYSPFVLYFYTPGSSQSANCDPSTGADCAATLFSNGATSGAAGGNDGGQTNLAIYYASTTNTFAMFFDDGGINGLNGTTPIDDNDYNDLVVTYTPAATSVPEPMTFGLLGMGLLGLGVVRRARRLVRTAA